MKTITILSRNTCAPCRQLKHYLDYKKVSYEVIDVDEQPHMLQGHTVVPVTIVEENGNKDIIEGYNLARISQAIA